MLPTHEGIRDTELIMSVIVQRSQGAFYCTVDSDSWYWHYMELIGRWTLT